MTITEDTIKAGQDALESTFDGFCSMPSNQIGDSWDSNDLISSWTGKSLLEVPQLVSVNAHFEQWQAQPAAGEGG